MQKRVDAEQAFKILHGSFVQGRQIEVNLATPRKFTTKSPMKRTKSSVYLPSPTVTSTNAAFNFANPPFSPHSLQSPCV